MELIKNVDFIDNLLKEDTIANLNVIGRIGNNRDIELYVDNIKNPQGFILKDGEFFAPYSKNPEVIKEMLGELEKTEMMDFCGIPAWIGRLTEDFFTDYKINWEEDCHLYYIPEDSQRTVKVKEPLGSLRADEVDIVNQYYTYKDENSREYLLECITNRPSSVIRNDAGQPVSWALTREDYSLGVMFTLQEYRKKGLAEKITEDLIYKVIEKGYTPYVHILFGNTASMALASKCGFENWGHVRWFGLKRK